MIRDKFITLKYKLSYLLLSQVCFFSLFMHILQGFDRDGLVNTSKHLSGKYFVHTFDIIIYYS